MMSIKNTAIQAGVKSLLTLMGKRDVFTRVVARVQAVNKQMPDATGEDKKKQFLADCHIIFEDLVVPVVGQMLNFLIEAALIYLKAQSDKLE
jgi:hypothetical protein